MGIVLQVEEQSEENKKRKETFARQTLHHFEVQLGSQSLVVLLDDEDKLREAIGSGAGNKGFSYSYPEEQLAVIHHMKPALRDCVLNVWESAGKVPQPYVYLSGSTCDSEISLVLTLAHELQHVVQELLQRELWHVNTVLGWTFEALNDSDFPHFMLPKEQDARHVSLQVAKRRFGEAAVRSFLLEYSAVDDKDEKDRKFKLELLSLPTFDLHASTKDICLRLSGRQEFKDLVDLSRREEPFRNVNWSEYLPQVSSSN